MGKKLTLDSFTRFGHHVDAQSYLITAVNLGAEGYQQLSQTRISKAFSIPVRRVTASKAKALKTVDLAKRGKTPQLRPPTFKITAQQFLDCNDLDWAKTLLSYGLLRSDIDELSDKVSPQASHLVKSRFVETLFSYSRRKHWVRYRGVVRACIQEYQNLKFPEWIGPPDWKKIIKPKPVRILLNKPLPEPNTLGIGFVNRTINDFSRLQGRISHLLSLRLNKTVHAVSLSRTGDGVVAETIDGQKAVIPIHEI